MVRELGITRHAWELAHRMMFQCTSVHRAHAENNLASESREWGGEGLRNEPDIGNQRNRKTMVSSGLHRVEPHVDYTRQKSLLCLFESASSSVPCCYL